MIFVKKVRTLFEECISVSLFSGFTLEAAVVIHTEILHILTELSSAHVCDFGVNRTVK